MYKPDIQLNMFALAVMLLYMCMFADGVPLCLSLCVCVFVCVPLAAGVSTAVGLPAAAPAGPAGPTAASAQPSEAGAAHDPAGTDRPATALPHSGSVHDITALHCNFVKSVLHQSPGEFAVTKHCEKTISGNDPTPLFT